MWKQWLARDKERTEGKHDACPSVSTMRKRVTQYKREGAVLQPFAGMNQSRNEPHEGALPMRTLEVEIFNARFTVRETGNETYLQALAAEVDARIQQIYE